jgi:hypothetical protein
MKKLIQLSGVFFVALMLLAGMAITHANPVKNAVNVDVTAQLNNNGDAAGANGSLVTLQGDGCLEIFMAWTDTIVASMAHESGSPERRALQAVAEVLFAALMYCIMQ